MLSSTRVARTTCLFVAVLVFVGSSAVAGGFDAAPDARFTLAQYYSQRPTVGYGPNRRPRDSEVPLPGSGQRIPVSAADAAADTWTGCQNWRNRFKEPFQRCCSMRAGVRRCYDQY
jgi:hypothetical protein